MSLENSFSKIKRNTGIKKCLIIDGNIGDVYLSNKSTRAKIVTLREYLEDMLKELDYREIVYWDRVEGAVGIGENIKLVDDKDIKVKGDAYNVIGLDDDDDDYDDYYDDEYDDEDDYYVAPREKENKRSKRIGNAQFKSPTDIFNIIYKNLVDTRQKSAFIKQSPETSPIYPNQRIKMLIF